MFLVAYQVKTIDSVKNLLVYIKKKKEREKRGLETPQKHTVFSAGAGLPPGKTNPVSTHLPRLALGGVLGTWLEIGPFELHPRG